MSQEGRTGAGRAARASYLDDSDEGSFSWSQVRHFLRAPLRRPLLVLVPWMAMILLSIAALLVLPKKYKSTTFILVESEKMPESFVPKVSTEDTGRHLETVKPEILSRTRLEKVLEETQPYPEITSRTRAVEKMRSSTFINIAGTDGFTIEFVHSNPHKAQEVTERLATLFIEETIKARARQVEGAVDFLVTQVNDARAELEKKDSALRRYKEERMGTLPEQLQTNLATMQMLQREMQTVEENLLFAREKRDALARGVRQSYASGPSAAAVPTGSADLADLRRQLAALRSRYTDEHPDVQNLRSRIARIEARMAEVQAAGDHAPADPSDLVTREQLETAGVEVQKLEQRRADLERRTTSIRARVDETPRTEQELATLTRDYQKLNENYVALLSKQLEAQMAGRLEQRWKGDRFRALDPANLPEKPYSPKPLLVVAMGVFLGLFLGLGASLVAEYLDRTVKDVEDLRTLQSFPVLACIPHHPGLAVLRHNER